MNLILVALFALITVAYPSLYSQDLPSSTRPKKEDAKCPDDKAWTGKYRNYSYGFTIVIPRGMKGFWNSASCVSHRGGCMCMQDHGRIIPLTPEPSERYIEAYANNGADLDEPTVPDAVQSHLRWIRERSREESVQVRKRTGITLAGLKAERIIVRYYDAKLQTWMIEDFVELVRRRDDVEYSLSLRTPEEAYEHDRVIFDGVVASFALSKRI